MTSNDDYIKRNKIRLVDDDKNSKLHYAAALGNAQEVEKILAKKQKIDPENYLGWTPLMMAVRNANFPVVNLLLAHGANATKTNKFGTNMLLISVASGDVDLVEKILSHLLCGGVSRRSLEKVLSPISLAVMLGHTRIYSYLLERHFDPNAATPFTGITPAMFAAAMGNNKALKKLMNYNADFTLKNYAGKTAADIVQIRKQKVHVDSTASKEGPQNLPLIVVNAPHQPHPQFQLTPFPIENGGVQHLRKSSNTITPEMLNTPVVTPIAAPVHQFFFGPDFTPSQFISPSPVAYQSNSFLNARVNAISPFFLTPQQVCHSYM